MPECDFTGNILGEATKPLGNIREAMRQHAASESRPSVRNCATNLISKFTESLCVPSVPNATVSHKRWDLIPVKPEDKPPPTLVNSSSEQ